MEKYIKYILISLFLVFSIFYTNKVIEISQYNNTILASINDYASKNDYKCIEGSINNDGNRNPNCRKTLINIDCVGLPIA